MKKTNLFAIALSFCVAQSPIPWAASQPETPTTSDRPPPTLPDPTADQVVIVPAPLPPRIALPPCPPGSVPSGTQCVDSYEASVWFINPSQTELIAKVRKGYVGLSDLLAGGAVQKGVTGDDYTGDPIFGCQDGGNGCTNIYAVSLKGVQPSAYITWSQAAAACRNAGKRLLTNAEWDMAAFGTPSARTATFPSACRGLLNDIGPTGTPNCRSDIGVFDMEGNVWEWTADRYPTPTDPQSDHYFPNPFCEDDLETSGGMECLDGSKVPHTFVQVIFRGGLVRRDSLLQGDTYELQRNSPAVGLRCAR